MCQLCTELSQYASTEIDVIGGWQQKLSYGFHEVKLFLATQMFDNARHFEAFRKRALSNGGGLGLENKGEVNRMLLESTGGWPETVVMLHLLRGTFTFTLYRYGELYAHNPAEKSSSPAACRTRRATWLMVWHTCATQPPTTPTRLSSSVAS